MQDIKELIATAKRPARTVELCLRGDLVADIETATRDLAIAQEFKDEAELDRLAQLIMAMKEEMADSVVTVRLESMARDKWLEMLAQHPERTGNDMDEGLGFNPESMYPAMIRESWAEPELEADNLEALLAGLNDGQFSELAEAAFSVNTRGAVVPFGWRGYKRVLSSVQK